ncbi:DUF5675 family protein [Collimonas sp.]|jgi:hypothetical protein|uniref:DUF5675 family protein n=1 Tax=Collimonas sp. TaxID=1963772 RepID=UPI002B7482EC|nr:DUF5675 family protein [Collimonas sp.]HWX01554.1 DUF5675 family protein [Collimonas sp.]
MQIVLQRNKSASSCTTGRLSIDGVFECFTLEDVVRPVKIKGETAIAAGTYDVAITMSARFKRPLPLLLNVPNYEGIRIHPGNTAADTEGCILPGRVLGKEAVLESRAAFNSLFEKIQGAITRKEKVSIKIIDGAAK